MADLKSFLSEQGYTAFKLQETPSKHFVLKAKINGIKGRFIVDTGASNSCVGLNEVDLFQLQLKSSNQKAAGAGSTNIETQLSKHNTLTIKKFNISSLNLIIIDLSHINIALEDHKTEAVNGIIGADILKKHKAVINYRDKTLYLSL